MARLRKFRSAVSSLVEHAFHRKGKKTVDVLDALRDTYDDIAVLNGVPTIGQKDEALEAAGRQFLFYQGQHLAKETPEATKKALVNAEYASVMFGALGQSVPVDLKEALTESVAAEGEE